MKPASEYTFLVFVMPVGPYFKTGFSPVNVLICRDHDRAAPLGTGHLKVGGNYAASMKSIELAHQEGYATAMYLDAKEKKYIDECGPANFFGIKDNTYITPQSHSILPSITNRSLQALAKQMGMKVEVRPVPVEELATGTELNADPFVRPDGNDLLLVFTAQGGAERSEKRWRQVYQARLSPRGGTP